MANVEFKSYEPTTLQGEAQVLINFRPHNDYHGEYGFDWVRMGDTGRGGDRYWYKDIMGEVKYDEDENGYPILSTERFVQITKWYDHLVSNQFRNFVVPWKTKSKKVPFRYIVPYMSLLPNYSAKLKIIVEVKTAPDKYEIRYNKNYFSVKELVAIPTSVGTKHINAAVDVKCLSLFDKDQFIEIYALKGEEESLAGKIIIKSNAKKNQRKIKVCFVKVEIWGDQTEMDLKKEKSILKKYLHQAYIEVDIREERITLKDENEIRKRLNDYSREPKKGWHYLLEETLRNQRKDSYTKYKYKENYNIFFLPFMFEYTKLNGASGYLLGKSTAIPSGKIKDNKPSLVIFDLVKTNRDNKSPISTTQETVTHELCHGMGLHHTFDNGSLYTFENYKTDNIMDYYSIKEGIKKCQLFKWQWDILQKQLG